MKKRGILHNAQQAVEVWSRWWPEIKAHLLCGGGRLAITIGPVTRSTEQNNKFHAMCEDFARCRVPWQGKPRDAAQWKVLLISGHSVATKEGAEIIPGLEGEFVNIRESSAAMSVSRSASLITYTQAYGDLLGVEWKESIAHETGCVA